MTTGIVRRKAVRRGAAMVGGASINAAFITNIAQHGIRRRLAAGTALAGTALTGLLAAGLATGLTAGFAGPALAYTAILDGQTLTLSPANPSAGGMVGYGGTLNLQNGVNVSDWLMLETNLHINVDAGATVTYSGLIDSPDDPWGFFKVGGGTLIVTGSNSLNLGAIISQGTLQVANGGALGRGQITLDGGTLQYGGALSLSNYAIGINQTGGTIDTQANNVVYGGLIYDNDGPGGSLTKAGSGTLTLTGSNTYSGTTLITGGTLQAGGANVLSARSTYDVASGTTLDLNNANNAIGGLSGAGDVTLGSATLTAGANNASTTYSGAIAGGGGLVKNGTGTLTLSGTNGYTGATTVTGGRLAVDGSLASSGVTVASGGELGGSGTINGFNVQSGGTIAPGAAGSAGFHTLSVSQNASFASGSTYRVVVDAAGHSDQLSIGGTAAINGGTVQVLAGSGRYAANTSYTILSATGGITGSGFGGATSNLAFLTPSVSQNAHTVTLTMSRNDTAFGDLGQGSNQQGAGNSAEHLGSGNALYDALVQLGTSDVPGALSQISGDTHVSAQNTLIGNTQFLQNIALGRLYQMDGGSQADTTSFGADLQATQPDATNSSIDHGISLWMRSFGGWGHQDSDGNAAAVNRSTAGVLVGGDHRLGDGAFGHDWRLGLLAGYSHSWIDQANTDSGIDSFHIGAYGGGKVGPVALRAGFGYSWNWIESSRDVVFPGFAEKLDANYHAQTLQAFAEAAYQAQLGPVALEPYAGFGYAHVAADGFRETGGAAALQAKSSTDDTPYTTLGLRASGDVARLENLTVTIRGGLGWQHAFGDLTPSTTMRFGGSTSFQAQGLPIARDALTAEAGIGLAFGKSLLLDLGYDGQVSADSHAHGVDAKLTWKF